MDIREILTGVVLVNRAQRGEDFIIGLVLRGRGNASIGASIIKPQGVAIRPEGVATGKDDIVNVPIALIGLLRTKDPRIAAENALLGSMQIKESHAQPI